MKTLQRMLEAMPYINTSHYETHDVQRLIEGTYEWVWRTTLDEQGLIDYLPRGVIIVTRGGNGESAVEWPERYRGKHYLIIHLVKPGKMFPTLMDVLASTGENAAIPHSQYVNLATALISRMHMGGGSHRYEVYKVINGESYDKWSPNPERMALLPYVRDGFIRLRKRPAGAEDQEKYIRATMREKRYQRELAERLRDKEKLLQNLSATEGIIENRSAGLQDISGKKATLIPRIGKHAESFVPLVDLLLQGEEE